MKPRQKRLAIVAGIAGAVAVAVALVLNAFQSNLVFFYSPSQVAAHEAPQARTFRIGVKVQVSRACWKSIVCSDMKNRLTTG